jgi:hypothetical protein
MAAELGFRIGRVRPAPRARVRKAGLMISRPGRPKEMLLTPRTVGHPSSSPTIRTARRVSRTVSCSALAVRVRQSM